MAVDLVAFRTQFPELADPDYPDGLVERALGEAILLHGLRDLATLYAAAHLAVLNSKPGALPKGEVKSGGTGPLRVGYRTTASKDGWEAFFSRTRYGQHFLVLERRTPRFALGAVVVG